MGDIKDGLDTSVTHSLGLEPESVNLPDRLRTASGVDSSDGQPPDPPAVIAADCDPNELPPAIANILAVGAVLAALQFIYLAFIHPDAANILIPLVLTPVLTFFTQRWINSRTKKE